MQTPVNFILAFVFVLALIGLVAWLVRRFAGNRIGSSASRGRLPRLAVIDAAAVDGRRRLVLVRRDNVEHLLMIGGPSDIVVEPNIVRAMPGRETAPAQRDTARGPAFPDTPIWADPADNAVDHQEPPALEPAPPRPARPTFIEEPRRPAAPLPERRPEPVVASTPPEPANRPEPIVRPDPVPARPLRSEMPRPMRADPPIRTMPPARPLERANVSAAPAVTPPAPTVAAPTIATPTVVATPAVPTPTAPSTPDAISAADQNLADMAQRLEAALRRPIGETKPEAPKAEAPEPRIGAPPAVPEAPAAVRGRSPEVTITMKSPVRAEAPPVAPPVKSGFENLEDEMASLLGRPKSSP